MKDMFDRDLEVGQAVVYANSSGYSGQGVYVVAGITPKRVRLKGRNFTVAKPEDVLIIDEYTEDLIRARFD